MLPKVFRLGDYIVEPAADRLVRDGSDTDSGQVLEPKTMAVLLALAQRSGEVVSSQQLIHEVWRDRPMGDNPVYKAVTKLRHALGDDASRPRYIETIPRKGYRLLIAPDPVEESHPPRSPSPTAAGQLEAVLIAAGPRTPERREGSALTWHGAAAAFGLALVLAVGALALPYGGLESDRETASVAPTVAGLSAPMRARYLQAMAELKARRPGFAARAEADANEVISEQPDFAPAHALRAIACLLAQPQPAGRPLPIDEGTAQWRAIDCARRSVRRALDLDHRLAEAHAAAGLLALMDCQGGTGPCQRGDQLDRAQVSLEQAIKIDPQLALAHTWLARVLAERGDLVAAAAHAEAAVRIDPLDPAAVCDAGEYLLSQGRFELARKRLLALAALPATPPYVYAQLAVTSRAAGRTEEALRWTHMLQRSSTRRAVQVEAAFLFTRLGDYAAAQDAWAAAGTRATYDDVDTRIAALRVNLALYGPSAVSAYFEEQKRLRAAEIPPDQNSDHDWRLFEGLAHAWSGQPELAVESLETVFGRSGPPTIHLGRVLAEADFANALAWAYAQTGNPRRAAEVAEGTLEFLEHDAGLGFDRRPELSLVRALSYDLAGNMQAGEAELRRTTALRPDLREELAGDPRWPCSQRRASTTRSSSMESAHRASQRGHCGRV